MKRIQNYLLICAPISQYLLVYSINVAEQMLTRVVDNIKWMTFSEKLWERITLKFVQICLIVTGFLQS